ncbi:hypothetical protein D6783_03640 [Candidatus Woesearchaeota archaeon]|nr:MAG: hypothetical protein D6783_03640 [Candidatus Woesearchaeota archaeon]
MTNPLDSIPHVDSLNEIKPLDHDQKEEKKEDKKDKAEAKTHEEETPRAVLPAPTKEPTELQPPSSPSTSSSSTPPSKEEPQEQTTHQEKNAEKQEPNKASEQATSESGAKGDTPSAQLSTPGAPQRPLDEPPQKERGEHSAKQQTSSKQQTTRTGADDQATNQPTDLPSFPRPTSETEQEAIASLKKMESSLQKLKTTPTQPKRHLLDRYTLEINKIIIDIKIIFEDEKPVPIYFVSISNISDTTKVILEKIRQEFVSKINLEDIENFEENEVVSIRDQFKMEIRNLIEKYFPHTDSDTTNMLVNYLIQENLGLGKIEILLKDPNLEEIVINNHKEPVWVYHRKYGWLETNIKIVTEARIRHYATMIGREVGKEITTLNPLMDAHLHTGDRVNATLAPISSDGNTITIRKFAADPWTITKFLKEGTISFEAAALIWLAIQNELSILIAGGTGSGKTSMLNVISNFFPPNQRIISIEDTRELVLPKTLHWVPMETRLPNPEGKGGVTMLDLLVNALRMRPDRIIVGEIRRQREAQVLLEAMHTGHSVYGTIHANNADETITRLTNPPIDIPKPLISAISMLVVQNRNRRTGKRRTLQLAEVLPNGDVRVLLRLNVQKDKIEQVNHSTVTLEKLKLYTGLGEEEIFKDLQQKKSVLQWMVNKGIEDVHQIGIIISKYYMGKLKLE